jgi:hypothetical protein
MQKPWTKEHDWNYVPLYNTSRCRWIDWFGFFFLSNDKLCIIIISSRPIKDTSRIVDRIIIMFSSSIDSAVYQHLTFEEWHIVLEENHKSVGIIVD